MNKIRFNLIIMVCFYLLFAANIQAQTAKAGTWKTYLAYQNATLVAATPNRVFAVYDGALLSYSPEDEEVKTYSFDDGLNDVKIVQMAYCPEANALVLVYENANIDLFYGEKNVVNLSSIKDQSGLPDKTVNNIFIHGKYAYLATGFGVVVVDASRREIKHSWYGASTMAVCKWDNYFYIATSEGLKRAIDSSNLQDKTNWQSVALNNYVGNVNRIEKLVVFKDQLVFYEGQSLKISYVKKDGTIQTIFTGTDRAMDVLNNQLVLCLYNRVFIYTELDQPYKSLELTASAIDSYNSEDTYWVIQLNGGLTGIKRAFDSSTYEVLVSGIQINSPFRNYIYYMTYTAGKLLIAGGGRGVNRSGIAGTFMIYEDGKWTNFDDQKIAEKAGIEYCRDLMSIAVDPRDPKHYFVSSWGEGVYEFNDTTLVHRYTYNNTNNTLQTSSTSYPDHYVRIDGLVYDNNNNLYMGNAFVQNALCVYTANGEWKSFYIPDMASSVPGRLIVTGNNQKWGVISIMRAGVFVFDDHNTPTNTSDDTYYYKDQFSDQQGTSIQAVNYYCIAEDLNGTIWVGTDNGPISFSSATQVGEGRCDRIIPSDQYDQGYYLMEGQRVTTIAVDGGNRKWMGTQTSGLFRIDDSDRSNVIVENFTTSNSQLISDNVVALAINNKTGEIFVGTDKGLMSYMGDAIEGLSDYSNVYAYPNPVKPVHNNQVIITGLMSNSQIKITDMAGNTMNQGTSLGGQYTWNCTNQTGEIVKAGIYLVFASTSNGTQGVATKIMVIK